jgi:hypothetical protein
MNLRKKAIKRIKIKGQPKMTEIVNRLRKSLGK